MSKCPYCFQKIEPGVAVCIHCKADLHQGPQHRRENVMELFRRVGAVVIFAVFIWFTYTSIRGLEHMYDDGYQAGLDQKRSQLFYMISSSYQKGYDEAVGLKWYFEKGCNDKIGGYYPQYKDVAKYMEGYNLCEAPAASY